MFHRTGRGDGVKIVLPDGRMLHQVVPRAVENWAKIDSCSSRTSELNGLPIWSIRFVQQVFLRWIPCKHTRLFLWKHSRRYSSIMTEVHSIHPSQAPSMNPSLVHSIRWLKYTHWVLRKRTQCFLLMRKSQLCESRRHDGIIGNHENYIKNAMNRFWSQLYRGLLTS